MECWERTQTSLQARWEHAEWAYLKYRLRMERSLGPRVKRCVHVSWLSVTKMTVPRQCHSCPRDTRRANHSPSLLVGWNT